MEDSGEFKARATEQVTEILDILGGSCSFVAPVAVTAVATIIAVQDYAGAWGAVRGAATSTSTPVTTTAVPPTALCPS